MSVGVIPVVTRHSGQPYGATVVMILIGIWIISEPLRALHLGSRWVRLVTDCRMVKVKLIRI